MKKARMIVISVLAVLAILFLFGWMLWSLGSIKMQDDAMMRLVILQGNAFVQGENGLEEQAKSGMFVKQGDVIRTAQNAMVAITIAGRSDLRLSENTQIKIDKAVMGNAKEYDFGYTLLSGRAWSRVLKLLDFDNAYESRTDNVVATVRGTAYGLAKSNEDVVLFVDKAVVGTETNSQKNEKIFTKDEWVIYDKSGSLINRGDIYSTSSPLNWDWIEMERVADGRFNEAAKFFLLESLKGGKVYAPDNWKNSLSKISARWHLLMSGANCSDLKARYFGRELFYVYDLVVRGKSGLAYQYFTDLNKKAHDDFINDKCSDKSLYSNQAGLMLIALSDTNPESEMYRLKLRIEEMYVSFFEEHSAEAFWARALALDSRLDELERFDCKNDIRGSMQQSLDAVTQGILRQERDFDMLPMDLNADVKVLLLQKTSAQTIRKNNFLEKLETCKTFQTLEFLGDATATSTTSTEMEAATSTDSGSEEMRIQEEDNGRINENNNQTDDQTETDQVVALNLARIQLFAQPNPINKGETAILFVKGIKKDGSEIDVTKNAIFEYAGSLGAISGNTFITNQAGTAIITVRVIDNGQQYNTDASLMINEPWVLSRLTASPVYGNRVYQGDSKQITATAYYTNGQNRDVSAFANYSLSDTGMGTMIGSSFRASVNTFGQVVVTVRYEENNVSLDDQVVLEVVYDY